MAVNLQEIDSGEILTTHQRERLAMAFPKPIRIATDNPPSAAMVAEEDVPTLTVCEASDQISQNSRRSHPSSDFNGFTWTVLDESDRVVFSDVRDGRSIVHRFPC